MKSSDTNLLMSRPIWFVQTLSDLKRHEGFLEFAYPDPLSRLAKLFRKENWGKESARSILARLGQHEQDGRPWTVGYGFTSGVNIDSRMTIYQADRKLETLLSDVATDLTNLVPTWKSMPDYVKTVLLNLDYNLGHYRLSKFAPTLQLFTEGKYTEAGDRLSKSLWYSQVGVRGKELVGRLRTGQIEPEHLVTV